MLWLRVVPIENDFFLRYTETLTLDKKKKGSKITVETPLSRTLWSVGTVARDKKHPERKNSLRKKPPRKHYPKPNTYYCLRYSYLFNNHHGTAKLSELVIFFFFFNQLKLLSHKNQLSKSTLKSFIFRTRLVKNRFGDSSNSS